MIIGAWPARPEQWALDLEILDALKSELERWDKASDEAWAMIEQWEAEEQ